jgi:hypothetical protein
MEFSNTVIGMELTYNLESFLLNLVFKFNGL